jgi:hypothetical protein
MDRFPELVGEEKKSGNTTHRREARGDTETPAAKHSAAFAPSSNLSNAQDGQHSLANPDWFRALLSRQSVLSFSSFHFDSVPTLLPSSTAFSRHPGHTFYIFPEKGWRVGTELFIKGY